MPRRKKIEDNSEAAALAKQIRQVSKGLYYVTETDAKISPFVGEKAEAVTKENLLAQTGAPQDSAVEEMQFEEFFNNLTALQDWFGEEEKQTAQKFSELRDLLQKNLRDLKVFKIGKIELDVYVVGLDSENVLAGIKTKAVAT